MTGIKSAGKVISNGITQSRKHALKKLKSELIRAVAYAKDNPRELVELGFYEGTKSLTKSAAKQSLSPNSTNPNIKQYE